MSHRAVTFDMIIFEGLQLAYPFVVAIVATASVSLISYFFFSNKNAASLKLMLFTLSLSISSHVVISNSDDLGRLWTAYLHLEDSVKFGLSFFIISTVALFGLLLLPAKQTPPRFETPASVDLSVEFEVPNILPADDKELFDEMFQRIKQDILSDVATIYEMPDEAVQWIDRMIQYNAYGGKMNRGLTTMAVRQTLAQSQGKKLTNKERIQSAALGWCVEFLQAFFLVADDVMDASVTRRGQPCWYKLDEVKLIAINDSFILESCVFKILKKFLGSEPYYHQLVDLFIECTRQTELGQLLDLTSNPMDGKVDLNRFTMERYTSIVKYKTAFYSFYLPVALGMISAGVKKRRHFQKAREILLIMGEYFQVQDDYLDCYGAPEVIGKIGTDIMDNKCGWLIVQALKIVTPEQRNILAQNYGKHNAACEKKVKQLYNDLNMTAIYEKYEEESYALLRKLLREEKEMPTEVFEFLLRKIYKRSK